MPLLGKGKQLQKECVESMNGKQRLVLLLMFFHTHASHLLLLAKKTCSIWAHNNLIHVAMIVFLLKTKTEQFSQLIWYIQKNIKHMCKVRKAV